MPRTALQSRRRAHTFAASRRQTKSPTIAIVAALTAILAVGLGLLLLAHAATRVSATGSDHTVGSASAPVVVDEWSDFE
jgi:hypothetical protein